MERLLAGSQDVVVSGTVENQVRFYDRFEHIVLLSAPLDVLMQRVRERTNNPYGKSTAEREEIARYVHTVEPLLRRGATVELDARCPVTELADAIERLISTPSYAALIARSRRNLLQVRNIHGPGQWAP